MTLLSLIAIIASVAASIGLAINKDFYWTLDSKDTPSWKRALWQTLHWFYLDEAPRWRRTLLKILFSALVLTALGCGFWDTYSSYTAESSGFFATIGIITISIASFILLLITGFALKDFKDWISKDYFSINSAQWIIVTINCLILCIWLTVFIFGLHMENSGRIFALISISAIITAVTCFILTALGVFCYVLGFYLIIAPLRHYIKWLLK